MKKLFFSFPILALIFAALGCSAEKMTPEQLQELRRKDKVFGFVEEVLLGTEYFSTAPLASKWSKKKIKLTVHSEEELNHVLVQDAVKELNTVLANTKFSLTILKPEAPKADMRVYFAPTSQFSEIARKHQFPYASNSRGYFYFWSGPGRDIYKAVVMINSKAGRNDRKHLIREEITQALGLSKDSPYSQSSVFYEKGFNGGKATTFSDLDRKLIHFFFAHVHAGFGEEKLAQAYQKYWQPES